MPIHGYREDGQPMFDNMKEFAAYERILAKQEIFNRNKFDWALELSHINSDIGDILGVINFGGALTKYIEELNILKTEFDAIYEKIVNAPKIRLKDTSIVDEFLSKIEVL